MQEPDTITQLYNLSTFYKRCQIPYLIKLFDFLGLFGIKIKSKVIPKDNQVVAIAFFLQNIKGITKEMTYTQLLEHIKHSEHYQRELRNYIHLFEIIYSYTCKENSFAVTYLENQLAIDTVIKANDNDNDNDNEAREFSYRIERLFSTEDSNNGFVNLNVLINELVSAQKELHSFFYYFHTHIQQAIISNFGSFAFILCNLKIANPINANIKRLKEYKDTCLSKCDNINPFRLASSYYNYYINLYNINDKVSNAQAYISNSLLSMSILPNISEWKNVIIKPFDTMKIYIMERVVKLKVEIVAISDKSKEKIIEVSKEVIEKMQNKYGQISAYITVRNNAVVIVVQKKCAFLYEKLMINFVNVIEMIHYQEAIERSKQFINQYYQKWLMRGEQKDNNDDDDGNGDNEQKEAYDDSQMQIERSQCIELSWINVKDKNIPNE